jgi:hypothetical protein
MGRFYALIMPLPDRISDMGDRRSFPGKEGEQPSEKNEEGQKTKPLWTYFGNFCYFIRWLGKMAKVGFHPSANPILPWNHLRCVQCGGACSLFNLQPLGIDEPLRISFQ